MNERQPSVTSSHATAVLSNSQTKMQNTYCRNGSLSPNRPVVSLAAVATAAAPGGPGGPFAARATESKTSSTSSSSCATDAVDEEGEPSGRSRRLLSRRLMRAWRRAHLSPTAQSEATPPSFSSWRRPC